MFKYLGYDNNIYINNEKYFYLFLKEVLKYQFCYWFSNIFLFYKCSTVLCQWQS